MTVYPAHPNQPLFQRLATRIEWRRQMLHLAELDDRLLADIGISRGDIAVMRRRGF